MKKDIEYLEGFIGACRKKLDNPKFIANAHPLVIGNERKKISDAQAKLEAMRRLGINEESKTVMINGVITPYLDSFTVEDSTFYITSVQKAKD
jgi:hypothetical protein